MLRAICNFEIKQESHQNKRKLSYQWSHPKRETGFLLPGSGSVKTKKKQTEILTTKTKNKKISSKKKQTNKQTLTFLVMRPTDISICKTNLRRNAGQNALVLVCFAG